MNEPSIFQYENARQYLLEFVSARQRENPRFSLRGLARRMGVSNSWLVLVLKNKRRLRAEHAILFARALTLGPTERLYFQTLVQYERARNLEEKQLHAQNLQILNPSKSFSSKETEEFEILSQWLHFAILSVLDLSGCDGSEKSIHDRLRTRATIFEVRGALERLVAQGILKRGPDRRVSKVYDWVISRNDARNEGARRFHKGVAELAVSAIESQASEERENQSFSFAISASKFPLARQMIRQFREQFVAAVAATDGDEVYQTNLQFFRLSDPPRSRIASRKSRQFVQHSTPRKDV